VAVVLGWLEHAAARFRGTIQRCRLLSL